MRTEPTGPSFFQRYLLPGFAFKAVVIGGGYATGRELAEFFLPSGPWGGVAAILLATGIWSLVCAITFAFAHLTKAYDYRTFFGHLLGPAWGLFEVAYILYVTLVLAVFGAAAGAIGAAIFGAPPILGSVALAAAIAAVVTFGNSSVERLFKYVSFLLYGVYALFVLFSFLKFHHLISNKFALPTLGSGWGVGGLTYASYNVAGAVVILPVLRHLTSRRDAIVAGLIAGPLAMLPALLFFICMIAFYPDIAREALPSDYMLRALDSPTFHLLFQFMIFAALLESGTGAVHAINERVAGVVRARRGEELSRRGRAAIAAALLVGCMFVANEVGLIALIGSGYRLLAYAILAVYIAPLLTLGVFRLVSRRNNVIIAPV